MEPPRGRRYLETMATTATAPTTTTTTTLGPSHVIAGLALAVFGGFSTWVVATEGYFGFLRAAQHDVWALQMLFDLLIACSFAIGWIVRDARARRIASWPYVVGTVFLGSI